MSLANFKENSFGIARFPWSSMAFLLTIIQQDTWSIIGRPSKIDKWPAVFQLFAKQRFSKDKYRKNYTLLLVKRI